MARLTRSPERIPGSAPGRTILATMEETHSGNHSRRLDHLTRLATTNDELRQVRKCFEWLYRESRLARYLECGGQSLARYEDSVPAESVVKRAVRKRLKPLEQHAKKFLSDAGRESLNCIPDRMPLFDSSDRSPRPK